MVLSVERIARSVITRDEDTEIANSLIRTLVDQLVTEGHFKFERTPSDLGMVYKLSIEVKDGQS